MPTQDYAASIQGVAIRVTRLDAAGKLLNGPGDSYVTSAFMRVSFTPEYEEGDEITEKSANGAVCVTYKSPDTLKRITMELAICEPDPELTNLVAGGLLLRKNLGTTLADAATKTSSIGWAAPAVGDDPAGYGVAIEAWSLAIKDGKRATSLPFFYWVFPFVKLRQSGDRVIENGMLASTFEGYGLGNINFNWGPDGRWEFPTAAERPYSYARSDWAPTGLKGFYTWNYIGEGSTELNTPAYNAVTSLDGISAVTATAKLSSNVVTLTTTTPHGFVNGQTVTVEGVDRSFVITKKKLDTNVVTLTFGAKHNFIVNDTIVVAGVDSTFNGTYTVASVPAGETTLTYAKTADNVTEVNVSGGTATRTLFDGSYAISGVPSTTSFTYARTHANVAGMLLAAGTSGSAFTTASAHGLAVGDRINVTEAVSSVAGAYNVTNALITAVGSTTTLTIDTTPSGTWTSGGTVALVVPSGSVVSVPSVSGASSYNVPGNVNFNADLAVDRVISSNEDPTA